MNTGVKQKELDEEGGRVSKERGLGLVMRRLGWGGWAPVSDVCLAYEAVWTVAFMYVYV